MLNVYLAGEIHSSWREEIIELCQKEKLNIKFSSPVTDHESSDNCGIEILGPEDKNMWKDRKGANINSIRTKKSIKDSDVVVVKFGKNTNNGMLHLMQVMLQLLENLSSLFIMKIINML